MKHVWLIPTRRDEGLNDCIKLPFVIIIVWKVVLIWCYCIIIIIIIVIIIIIIIIVFLFGSNSA